MSEREEIIMENGGKLPEWVCCANCRHKKVDAESSSNCALDSSKCKGPWEGNTWEYNLWEPREDFKPEGVEIEVDNEEELVRNEQINPSVEQSTNLIAAFDYLNVNLFDNLLPRPMLIFTRNVLVVGGYFSPQKWFNTDAIGVDEIAINANSMVEGDEIELFQVLIHEMVHQWQHHFGIPGRGGYHNRQWADKCLEIGLKPVNVNDPDAETGDSITTVLITGGKAMVTLAKMPEDISIPFYAEVLQDANPPQPVPGKNPEPTPTPAPKSGRRTKYTCVMCGTNLWGKSGLSIQCLLCDLKFVETKNLKSRN